MKSYVPSIPQHYRNISNMAFLHILITGLIFGLLGGGLSYILSNFIGNLFIKIPIIFLLSVLSGLGFYLLANMAHEGGHGNLNRNVFISYLIGVIFSSLVPFYLGVAYMVSHWPHHKFTNTEQDPQALALRDSKMNSKPRLLAFLLCGIGQIVLFFQDSFCLLFASSNDKILTLKRWQIILLVLINYFLSTLMLFIYYYIISMNLKLGLLMIIFPYFCFLFLCGIFLYLEHGDTKLNSQNSRSNIHALMSFFMVLDNYHLEHHLYPHIQRHNLPKIHAYLDSIKFFDKNPCIIEGSLLGTLKTLLRSNYPCFDSLTPNK